MVLLRHLLGDALRRLRLRQGRTLREVSASARVSLGYLSEVERGQKEASSELLAAICSALGAPLSQVLREVSDNFALAELQSEPVFADVIEPPIEVNGVSHGSGRGGDQAAQEEVPVGPVGSERMSMPAEQRVPAGAGSRVPAGAGQLGLARSATASGPVRWLVRSVPGTSRPGRSARARSSRYRGGYRSGRTSPVGEPAFDQVTRTVREITNMVPV